MVATDLQTEIMISYGLHSIVQTFFIFFFLFCSSYFWNMNVCIVLTEEYIFVLLNEHRFNRLVFLIYIAGVLFFIF